MLFISLLLLAALADHFIRKRKPMFDKGKYYQVTFNDLSSKDHKTVTETVSGKSMHLMQHMLDEKLIANFSYIETSKIK